MATNRREFVALTVGLAAGCASVPEHAATPAAPVDAGPVTAYASDGVYDAFRDRGFFIVRRADTLMAISAICTHRTCKLRPEPDQSFYCKCHGSTFDSNGKVTEGPASRALPVFPSTVDANGHLIVQV